MLLESQKYHHLKQGAFKLLAVIKTILIVK